MWLGTQKITSYYYVTAHNEYIITVLWHLKHTTKQNRDDYKFIISNWPLGRSQWPRCLRLRLSASRLLRSWVRITPGAWMSVCCECCVLSGRGLCDGLITRPEESYRLWRVVVCDQETSKNEEAKARYRAVENTTTMGCNVRKTDKQQLALRL
jgi:hypothetical protein